jgi:hypothetical protein
MSPRKARNVTPQPDEAAGVVPLAATESDLPDDIEAFAAALVAADDAEAQASGGARADGVIGEVDPDELSDSGRAIVVATEVLADFRTAIGALQRLGDIPLETPDQRQLAVKLWNRLAPIETTVGLWRSMLEARFRDFLQREGASRATLPDGRFVSWEAPPATWQADGHAIRQALEPLVVQGVLTQEQVDEAAWAEVSYRVNHTKLNALAARYGTRVQDAIEAHRHKVPSSGPGKVVLPKEVK